MTRAISLAFLIVLAVCCGARRASAQNKDEADRLRNLPKGWVVTRSVPAFDRELGERPVRITNTFLDVNNHSLQVNTIACQTEEDAVKVQEALLRIQGSIPSRYPREGRRVFELIGEMKMIERAYLELGFQPQRVAYDVSFRAAPVVKCDAMAWNKMYNALLQNEPNEDAIRNLSKSFTFGNQIQVRNHGVGRKRSAFVFAPKPDHSRLESDGEITVDSFSHLEFKQGVPQFNVSALITCEAFAITPSMRRAGKELLDATEFWPSTDAELVDLARQITGQSTDAGEKLAALLAWFSNKENFKFDNRVVGSRYGVKTALKQRFGMCWDYSDCFVTLCRTSGVPCRQVYGWLYPVEGHIWAEVLIDGEGWRQVDPQTGAGCDSRYVPFIASESGAMGLVYTSAVRIVPRETKDRNR